MVLMALMVVMVVNRGWREVESSEGPLVAGWASQPTVPLGSISAPCLSAINNHPPALHTPIQRHPHPPQLNWLPILLSACAPTAPDMLVAAEAASATLLHPACPGSLAAMPVSRRHCHS